MTLLIMNYIYSFKRINTLFSSVQAVYSHYLPFKYTRARITSASDSRPKHSTSHQPTAHMKCNSASLRTYHSQIFNLRVLQRDYNYYLVLVIYFPPSECVQLLSRSFPVTSTGVPRTRIDRIKRRLLVKTDIAKH